MAKLISKAYASALFEAGLELDKIIDFQKELTALKEIFLSEPQLIEILQHPKVSKSEKKDLLEKLFKNRVSEELINFLFILIDKRRERNLFEIIEDYNILFNDHQRILKVEAVTAVAMDEKAKEKLKIVLKNKLNKNIELTNTIDKSIIGGVLLKIENKIVDGTLMGQLRSMEIAIKGGTLG